MRCTRPLVALVFCVLLLPHAAHSATVSYIFSGTVDSFSASTAGNILPALAPGSAFSGTISYDPAAAQVGVANYDPSSLSISLTFAGIGSFVRSAPGSLDEIRLIDDAAPGIDLLMLHKEGAPNPSDFDPNVVSTRLWFDVNDMSGTIAPGPLSTIDISDTSPSRVLYLLGNISGPSHVDGNIVDAILQLPITSITQVPEPSAWGLALLGTTSLAVSFMQRARYRGMSRHK